jgi:hypothetical protein
MNNAIKCGVFFLGMVAAVSYNLYVSDFSRRNGIVEIDGHIISLESDANCDKLRVESPIGEELDFILCAPGVYFQMKRGDRDSFEGYAWQYPEWLKSSAAKSFRCYAEHYLYKQDDRRKPTKRIESCIKPVNSFLGISI